VALSYKTVENYPEALKLFEQEKEIKDLKFSLSNRVEIYITELKKPIPK
jgi:hypothetical protein